ncbi:MBL fold metallo-hydrolase [Actinoplanes oblitus]|uniref:MBL fold metallo-hydrolase n=1 Tax=Actinoplanes oblitus TaxID=3040509 RepID=A0ABY8WM11_9ACTN|nr:MBL fold metallo-hydrolase [Actinoplanes oblitus]WIM98462.1 MBL fold metallo-hydrolase [Actinoplanes oblitus]
MLGLAVYNTVTACSSSAPPSEAAPTGNAPASAGSAANNAFPAGWKRVNLGFVSAYLLLRGKEVAVIDTGTPGSAESIHTGLKAAGADWAAVKHVIITHYHPDHAGSVDEIFPQVKSAFYAGAGDAGNIVSDADIKPLDEGDDVFGLRVVNTPGHTAGHISILDTSTGTLVAGDALRTQNGLEGSDPQFTADETAAIASVKKLAGLDIKAILPGHGEPLTSGAKEALQKLAASL